MDVNISGWEDYARYSQHNTVAGTLKMLTDLWSPELDNHRSILVHLPPSYSSASDRRYPVVYMHDAQNLFDQATSYAGVEWQVDETMQMLSAEGFEAIIVAVPHMGSGRFTEYNPFPGFRSGRGEDYLNFLVNTLKPRIDADFRTLAASSSTGIMGSSMGGLISLYGYFRHPDVFGFAGVMSPALWVAGGAIYSFIQSRGQQNGKIYLDNGTRESSARKLHALLLEAGYQPGKNLLYMVESEAEHNETAWARRLPIALRFLLG